jgi:hypothetical protein
MDRIWANIHYRTTRVDDTQEGWSALELSRDVGGQVERVARIIYWDAEGQFAFEMFVKEIPLSVLEELLAEAKKAIPVR